MQESSEQEKKEIHPYYTQRRAGSEGRILTRRRGGGKILTQSCKGAKALHLYWRNSRLGFVRVVCGEGDGFELAGYGVGGVFFEDGLSRPGAEGGAQFGVFYQAQ